MLKWIKWISLCLLVLLVIGIAAPYIMLRASLPDLDREASSDAISAPLTLARDHLGQAVIQAESRNDAAFALGFAHAQDRFFQMDLQRRAASGELSEWVGQVAVDIDKRARFHQFSQRARDTFTNLPDWQQDLLIHYAKGVNAALDEFTLPPPEYLLAGVAVRPWQAEDSLLVVYSMYMDLQRGQVSLDWARHAVHSIYGNDMLAFLTQPSRYQAALDGSEFKTGEVAIPAYPSPPDAVQFPYSRKEPKDIGSNNWAVTGALTDSRGGMLANDMHLGLRVPIIWYRAQLNYTRNNTPVSVTGVSLPGLPGIVVGTNGHIAWGFTNANLDTVDWIKLTPSATTRTISDTLVLPDGSEPYTLTVSDYGPVRSFDGEQYALRWVAHMPYAVNLAIADLDLITHVDGATDLAHTMGIPTQNMMVVDVSGNAAWTPAGALPARHLPSYTAIGETGYDEGWSSRAANLPKVKNPQHGKLWTANSRVISSAEVERFGNGGYALGARASQIRDRLMEKDSFNEQDFYAIQLDNRALFLKPWHTLLVSVLKKEPQVYQRDVAFLNRWQGCACPESVGYTLVRHFRSKVSDLLLGPILQRLEDQQVNSQPLLRGVEPALWQLLAERPDDWLPAGYDNYNALLMGAYDQSRNALLNRYNKGQGLDDLSWGNVNALKVSHPFAAQIPFLGERLNMPVHPGFGDSYMPAVQRPDFGASQRLFVRPDKLENAILTLPGGQSGHPLSPYFRRGYQDYVDNVATPLLPGKSRVTRRWQPAN